MKKVIIVTGVSSGLGKSVAEMLVKDGHRVYGTSRKDLTMTGVTVVKTDICSNESVTRMVESVMAAEGRVDVLVNNAGMGIAGSVEDCSMPEIEMQLNTNFLGSVRACKAVIPIMRRQNSGLIINVGSLASIFNLPFQAAYSASKCAIDGFSNALRMEVKPWGIRVTVVSPGDFKTGFTANRIITPDSQLPGNVYRNQFHATLGVYEKDETNGANPLKMAKLVSKLVASNNPGWSYMVGKTEQKIFLLIKKILPTRIFMPMMGMYYKVGSKPM